MRYEVQDWVCDYGIWDLVEDKFVGAPIDSYYQAKIICDWKNRSESTRNNFIPKQRGEGFDIWDIKQDKYLDGEPMSIEEARRACESINRVIL